MVGKKDFNSSDWGYFSSFPSHFLMGTQQGLYSSLIVSDDKILVFSRRPSLHLHTCIHTLSFTVLTSSAMHCPLSLSVHIAITKAFCVSSLGLLSHTFLKTNITFLGLGCQCVPLPSPGFTPFLPTSFPYLFIQSFSQLPNTAPTLWEGIKDKEMNKRWFLPSRRYINRNPNAMCSEWF